MGRGERTLGAGSAFLRRGGDIEGVYEGLRGKSYHGGVYKGFLRRKVCVLSGEEHQRRCSCFEDSRGGQTGKGPFYSGGVHEVEVEDFERSAEKP